MDLLTPNDYWTTGCVRIRASAQDAYAGLRGHAYIAARRLGTPVPRLDFDLAARERAVGRILRARGGSLPTLPAIPALKQLLVAPLPVLDQNASFAELSAHLATLLVLDRAQST